MKNFYYGIVACLLLMLSSCTVTESIVFNDDYSGEYLMTYDMGEVMKQMGDAFKDMDEGDDMDDSEDISEKNPGKIMDTMMVFNDIMETYKDSVAALPEEKRLALEAVRDMYMKMYMNEDEGIFNFGVGMNFDSIDDLKNIQEKIQKAQSLNAQNEQVDAMKDGSPIGKFMGGNNGVAYKLDNSRFSRITNLELPEGANMDEIEDLFNDEDPTNAQMMTYFENAYYTIELSFPKPIKSVSVENAEISDDRKSVRYKKRWIEYLKNPKDLDIEVTFDE